MRAAAALLLLAACSGSPAPPTGRIVFAARSEGRVTLHAVQPNGEGLRRIAADPAADFYPAPGPRLAAVKVTGDEANHREQLVLMEGAGPPRAVGPMTARIRNPSFSADGASVVFESDHESFRDIYRLDLVAGGLQRLTANREGNFEPALSPDGKRIAFASSRDGDAEIYVAAPDGSAQQRLTAFHRQDFLPSWSPDGAWLAFLSDREGADRVFLMRPDGTDQRKLDAELPADSWQEEVVWSPSGRWLAYVLRGRDGSSEIWTTEVATGVRTRLSRPGADDRNPAWSPDGRHLVYASGAEGSIDLYVVRADGGGATRLTSAAGDEFLPRWLP